MLKYFLFVFNWETPKKKRYFAITTTVLFDDFKGNRAQAIPEKEFSKVEISNISDKEIKIMNTKCSMNLGEWMNIVRISTELENI